VSQTDASRRVLKLINMLLVTEILFTKYKNLLVCIKDHLKHELLASPLEKKEFTVEILNRKYVITYCTNSEGKKLAYIITHKNSKFTTTSSETKRLLARVDKKVNVIHIIAKHPFTSYSKRLISRQSKVVVFIPHKRFTTILPNSPDQPKAEIVDETGRQRLLKTFKKPFIAYPKIKENDAVAVWIGAKVGDMVKFTYASQIAGKSIKYRLCIKDVELMDQSHKRKLNRLSESKKVGTDLEDNISDISDLDNLSDLSEDDDGTIKIKKSKPVLSDIEISASEDGMSDDDI
jgi:DNA-directed RNA polymerase subunit H (RpoH/RPB5)